MEGEKRASDASGATSPQDEENGELSWDDPRNLENPQNWSMGKKVLHSAIPAVYGFALYAWESHTMLRPLMKTAPLGLRPMSLGYLMLCASSKSVGILRFFLSSCTPSASPSVL